MSEVDNLEIKVEATSRGANQQLKILIGMMDELSAKLNGINTKNFESLASLMKSMSSMSGVVKNASNSLKETTKELNNVSNASKKAKEVLANMKANASNIGRSFSLPTGIIEQQKALKTAQEEYDRLIQRQEKYIMTGKSTDSQAWINLQYDLIKAKNKVDDLTESIRDYQSKATENIKFEVSVPKFEEGKFDLSQLILSQNSLGLEETFQKFGTTVNSVFGDVRNNIDNTVAKLVDLSSIDVSSAFSNMQVKDDAPYEIELISEKYNKLREQLLELENIYNEAAESSKNFTELSAEGTNVNVAQQTVERIQEVVAQMTNLIESAKSINDSIAKPFENLVDVSYLSDMNIKQLKEELKNTSEELKNINNQVSSWGDKSGNIDFNAVDSNTLEDMNYYKQLIPQIQDRIAQLKVEGNGGFLSGLSASFSSFKQDAETTGSKIEALKLAFSSLTGYMSQSGNIGLMVASGAMKGIATACSGAISVIKALWSSAKKIAPVFKTIGSVAMKSFSKIASVGVAPISKAFKGLGNVLGSVNKKIQRTAKMFSLMILRKALRAVIDNITNSFQELAKQNANVNANVSGIVSNFKWLGASITAAFAPILNIVSPILDALVSKCVSVINTIGQVFASLTGSKTFTVAKKVQTNYAGSLDNTASSANNASKALKEYENQLMGFDEINKLTDNSSSGSGGSGGSGGGAGGSAPEYVFETANVESQYNNWADMIKEAWNNGDFTELGQIAGQKIADALNSIPWDKIQTQANKIASSVATFINGAMHSDLFSTVGTTIGEALNTAFGMAYTFIDKFEFGTFGTKVAELLNSAFETIDFTLIANTITGSINGVFETILNFATEFKWGDNAKKIADGIKTLFDGIEWETITNSLKESGKGIGEAINELFYVDKDRSLGGDLTKAVCNAFNSVVAGIDSFIKETKWDKLGKNLADSIKSIVTDTDWKLLGTTLSDAIVGAFNGLTGFFEGIDWDKLGQDIIKGIKDFFSGIKWGEVIESVCDFAGALLGAGADLIAGLLKGIGDALASIGTWINENMVQPFIKKVKEFFGIHSPSTVFADIGKYLIEGLKEGIKNTVSNIGNWLKENVVDKIKNGISNLKDGVLDVAVNLKGKVEDTFNKAKDAWNGLKAGAKELWAKGKGTAEKAFNTVKSAWGNLTAGTKSLVASASAKGQTALNNLKSAWGSFKNNATKTFTAFAKGKKDSVFSSISGVIGKAGKTVSIGVKLAKSGWTSIKNWIMGKVKSFKLPIHLPKIKVNWGEKKVAGFKIKFPKGFSTYAQGGFPNMGQMFIAREQGPELVGKIGNRNAVVNNNQIIEGVSSGVYNAVLSAMSVVGNNNNNVNVTLVGDTKKIFKVVQQEGRNYQLATGNSVF